MKQFLSIIEDYWFVLLIFGWFLGSQVDDYYDHVEAMKDKEIRKMIVKDSLDRL